jgi:hypothetical protein
MATMTETVQRPATPNTARDLNARLSSLRRSVAMVLAAIALLGLIGAGYCLVQLSQGSKTAEKNPDKPDVVELDPLTNKPAEVTTANAERGDLLVLLLAGLTLGLSSAGYAAYLFGRPPGTVPQADDNNRRLIAWATVIIGGELVLAGVALLVVWFSVLVDWADGKSVKQAWKPVSALLLLVFGSGLMFGAAYLLRPDERASQKYRRVAFGLNTGLTLLFVLIGLLVVNVLVSVKVPAKIDTTTVNNDPLHPDTVALLKGLKNDIVVYSLYAPGSLTERETRVAVEFERLANKCKAANPARFSVVTLSDVSDARRIEELQRDHPEFKRIDRGILVVAAGQPGRFVSGMDMLERNRESGVVAFTGEQKLVSAILASTSDNDAVVYVLQGHGELNIGEPDALSAGRGGQLLAQSLQKVGNVVRPLKFDDANAVVPPDASVLVVADPTVPLSETHLGAIRSYLKNPRPNKKAGKLVVLAGPHANAGAPGAPGALDTGLNGILAPFGITLAQNFLYFQPTTIKVLTPEVTTLVAAGNGTRTAPNPIALQFAKLGLYFKDCQEVTISPDGGGSYLFGTSNGRGSWVEASQNRNPMASIDAMYADDVNKAQATREKLKYMTSPRPVAAANTTQGVARVVVFGSGEAFADPTGENGRYFQPNAELLVSSVNWLRERPAAAQILGRPTAEFRPGPNLSFGNAVLVPALGVCMAVLALGLGVWVARRK